MNIEKLYRDFGIPTSPLGHKHSRTGWVNTSCPFCYGNPGFHLGFCINKTSIHYNRFVCWRCGGKKTLNAVSAILKIPKNQVLEILKHYGKGDEIFRPKQNKKPAQPIRNIILPPNTENIRNVLGAMRYLENRKFDTNTLIKAWDICATGPGSIVVSKSGMRMDFSYRIIIPIYWKGKLVSYQGRDWTGKNKKKYLDCLPEMESYPIKSTLYGIDKLEGVKKIRLVEGVTDVWNVPMSTCCYGIKYTEEQVRLLLEFDEVDVMFDEEPQATKQSRKIITYLEENGKKAKRLHLPNGKDPAELNEEEKRRILQ